MEFALFLCLLVAGAIYIMEMLIPGLFQKSYHEILSVANVPGLITGAIYDGGVRIMQIPDVLLGAIGAR